MKKFSRVRIGKVSVDRVSMPEILREVRHAVESQTRLTIVYANSHGVTLAENDADFAAAMSRADCVFCDGFGVYVASRALGSPVPERFAWPDWIEQLCRTVAGSGSSMFFLGAQEGVAADAGSKLQAKVPGLTVHSHHGHFPKDEESSLAVIEQVNASGAEVLLVGFGMPLQELWIDRFRSRLKPAVVFSVGALFDYSAERLRRGPPLLTQHGFEWLTRLVAEPRRLWRRYLLGLPAFGAVVARQWADQKLGAQSTAR